LDHVRETRFPVPKINIFGTPSCPIPYKTSPFCATGVPKISEFAPEPEVPKFACRVVSIQCLTVWFAASLQAGPLAAARPARLGAQR
jgi:hypothetical protein